MTDIPLDPYAPDAQARRRASVLSTCWYLVLYLVLIAVGLWAGVWLVDQVAG